jgi:hypothetical protein
MHIRCKDGKIYLNQSAYLQKVVECFNLQNAKPAPTPLPEGYQPSPVTENASATLHSKYQQVIGSLLYIMLGMQPDIAFVVTKLSPFTSNPTEKHLGKALYSISAATSWKHLTMPWSMIDLAMAVCWLMLTQIGLLILILGSPPLAMW